jgi:hemerythrin-like domain-containing protein
MDAIQFLKQEHEKAKAAFGKVLQAPPDKRGALWAELKPELEAHEQIEDACLYEPLSHDVGPKDSKLAAWRQQHRAEIHKIEGLIKSMDRLLAEDARWLSTAQDIHSSLASHIREEEDDIFPRISKVWDETRLKRAGTEMEDMKSKKKKQVA